MPSVSTSYGTFVAADSYKATVRDDKHSFSVSASIDLSFTPSDTKGTVATRPVGLIQACRVTRAGLTIEDQLADEPLLVARIKASPGGWYIDQYSYAKDGKKISEAEARKAAVQNALSVVTQTNPVYNAMNTKDKNLAVKLLDNTGENSFGQIFHPTGKPSARLIDTPGRILLPDDHQTFIHEFEVAAVTLTDHAPRYLGSVRWGYEARREGNAYKAKVLEFALISDGQPSSKFVEAAVAWNNQKLPDYATKEKISRVAIPV